MKYYYKIYFLRVLQLGQIKASATDSTHSDSTRPNIIIPMLCNRCRERGIFNVGQSLPSSLSLSTSHTVCGHIPYHTFLITHSIIYGRNNYPPVRGQLFPVPKSIVIKPLKQIHCNKFTSLDFNNSQEDSSIISARNLRMGSPTFR